MPCKGRPCRARSALASTCHATAITPLSCVTIFQPAADDSPSPSRPKDTNNSVPGLEAIVRRHGARTSSSASMSPDNSDNLIHFLQR